MSNWAIVAVAVSSVALAFVLARRKRGFAAHVGNTSVVKLQHLSDLLGCEIYGKAEYTNPGGSVKDRLALAIVQNVPPGSTVYEGTSGSTGISLAMACAEKGIGCTIVMPDDQAREKSDLIRSLGAKVHFVRPMSIVDPNHMCKLAEQLAKADPRGVFANQFESKLNFQTHFEQTGPEILKQLNVDVFVASAGTGGTIAGVSARLKLSRQVHVILADPQGSGLANRVNHGTLFNLKDKEGHRVRHPYDTITEGVGLNRITANFQRGIPFIDAAFEITDQECVKMAKYLRNIEGLFLGSSSALNVACIVKAFKCGQIKRGDVVLTIFCDEGTRHASKFWNTEYLQKHQLCFPPEECTDPLQFVK